MGRMITDAHPGSRFYVEVGGATQAVFTEASGFSYEMAIEDVEEGGNNGFVHRLPGRCKVGNLTLKRGLTRSLEFLKWNIEVANGGEIKRQNLSVILYNSDGTEWVRWNFKNAYPVKWSGPQIKSDDASCAIETLEFAHEGLSIDAPHAA